MSLFITFEGPEGCGKTTQTQILFRRLRENGHPVLLVREPGSTALGERLREILLHATDVPLAPRAETLLFSASRAQFVDEVIRPRLEAGDVVICDRYADSTLAYQGYGRELNLDALRVIQDFATSGLTPDLTFLLDLPAEDGLRRKQQSALLAGLPAWDHFEAEELAFHHRVREGYRRMAAIGGRWVIVDASQSPAAVERRIWEHVCRALAQRV